MTQNRIHPINEVMIEIYEEGKKVDTYEGSGFHTVEGNYKNMFWRKGKEDETKDSECVV